MTRSALVPAGIAACLLLAAQSPALAAAPDREGWYATALAGVNFMSDQSLEFSGVETPGSANASLDSGFLAGAALGYGLTPNWRVELEFTYQSVDHDGLMDPSGTALAEGNFASTGLALNGLYEFNAFGSDRARTYVGLGAVWLTEVDIDFEQPEGELSYSGDDFGLQILAGARYDFSDRLFVDAGLRYLAASSIQLDGEQGAAGRITADYEPWSVTVAVGWRF